MRPHAFLAALLLVSIATIGTTARAADCNENGVEDFLDIAFGTSLDLNGDGIPDECQPACDDCDGNGLADAIQRATKSGLVG